MKPKVITRFAPSPTGHLHIGGARTALFNFLFARGAQGKFILRIEDTDRGRSTKEFEQSILDGLAWLGLSHDEFYRQSERGEIYAKHLQTLLEQNKAYWSEEKREGGETSKVIRFRNPGGVVTFTDLVRGEIKTEVNDLGDIVIAKTLTEPLYHFTVVVDDWLSEITHVVRGDDHIANTPRQILIQEALGAPRPIYCHLPLILAPDRSKLSKRHGAVALTDYRERGYVPGAVINFLALLGWHPETDQEVFDLEALAQAFRLERIQKGGAVFDQNKLDWFNRQYLQMLSPTEQKIYLERALQAAGEFNYFAAQPIYPKELLKNQNHLAKLQELITAAPADNFTAANVKAAVWDYATEAGRGEVLWPMRVALSGRERSPDPFILAEILGQAETLKRLSHAASL